MSSHNAQALEAPPSQAADTDPARAAQRRIVQAVAMLVIVAAVWIGALAAFDVLDPHQQYLSLFRGAPETVETDFHLCESAAAEDNCVLSGEAFRYHGQRYAVAGLDAPRRFDARCASEAALGENAAAKLQQLLNEGPFEILQIPVRPVNRHLVALRRAGVYFADQMIHSGLARRRILFARRWCD